MSLIRKLSKRLDFNADSRKPYNTDGARPQSSHFEKEAKEFINNLTPAISPWELPAFLDAVKNMNGKGLDDRLMLLEDAVKWMSKRKGTHRSEQVQQTMINLLYKDLPHPPSGYACLPPPATLSTNAAPPVPYAFRAADGSNYNPLFPTMGKAGSPYARSVPSTSNSPKNALPDAGLLFDTLLKRDKFKPHPDGISSLFFGFADLVIHSIFDTDHTNPQSAINSTSSYLDLSVLYGNSDKDVANLRLGDGTGRLHNDVFADWRLLHMPPASCALLVLLSRNHNFIAQRILDINENKTYVDPTTLAADSPQKMAQDEEIFQRTRLVNCGFFMHIILGDYVGAILGLVRDQSDWRLDPLQTIRQLNHEFAPVGEGNVVSVEFNMLYRWHATLSQSNEKWFKEEVFEEVFPGKAADDVTPKDFMIAAHGKLMPDPDLKTWTFGGLQRDADGRFSDEDLAKILHDATENVAGSFGARNIPEHMRVIEIMAITQSRNWGTCSLNEFRKFLGLKPYESFQEWNPDEEIHAPHSFLSSLQTTAAALYRDIDNLELHVGLQAEEIKRPGPGAGLCPGYTISRAILADAVCLTRGDRFLTVDFTPHNLTAWGYQDCQYDHEDGSFGGLLTKLLFRTLPDHYPVGSAYAHFPFLQPERFKKTLGSSNPELASKYKWERPKSYAKTVIVDDFEGVKRILEENTKFLSSYDRQLVTVVSPTLFKKASSLKGSQSSGSVRSEAAEIKARNDEDAMRTRFARDAASVSKYIFGKKSAPEAATYFGKTTQELIETKSFDTVGHKASYIDIVKDVINLLPIYWLSQEAIGLPLKTKTNENGAWYEQETYDKFAKIAEYVYLNFDPSYDWHLRESSQSSATDVIDIIKGHVEKVDSWLSLGDSHNHAGMPGSSTAHANLKQLWTKLGKGKSSHREFASQIFAAAVPTAALYSQDIATVVSFYLEDTAVKIAAREEIIRLDASTDEDAAAKAMVYFYEALRVNSPISGVYRTSTEPDNFKSVGPVKAGQNIFVDIHDANLDESVFGANASTPDFARPASKAGITGFVNQGFMTPEFLQNTVPPVLAAIFKRANLKRAPGESGQFTKFEEGWNATQRTLYASQRGLVTPWPESLIIQFSKQN